MNYLDRNEFNFEPSQKVVDAIRNFDPKTLCFYTRIYDEGKKSVIEFKNEQLELFKTWVNLPIDKYTEDIDKLSRSYAKLNARTSASIS